MCSRSDNNIYYFMYVRGVGNFNNDSIGYVMGGIQKNDDGTCARTIASSVLVVVLSYRVKRERTLQGI